MPSSKNDTDFTDFIKSEIDVPRTTLDNVITWIQGTLDPDDVFETRELEDWAASNGYVKE